LRDRRTCRNEVGVIARLRRAVSDQLSRPAGPLGRIVAALMNRGNRDLNARAIDLLDVTPGSRVLDLGFGGGLTFAPLLARSATAVVGVDRATDMIQSAEARHREAVASGRLILRSGEVQDLPLEDAEVDRVLTVNTVYFWPDLDLALREVRRVLEPRGRLVIGIRDGSVMQQVSPEVFTLRTPDELASALELAGFGEVRVRSAPDRKTHLIEGVA
jgi:arsenite methyltransferase